MKNFAKIIAVLLILCTVFSLCACGKDSDKGKETTDSVESTSKEDKDKNKNKETDADTTDGDTTAEDTTGEDTTDAETTKSDTTASDTTAKQTQQTSQTTSPTQQTQQTQQTTNAVTNPSGNEILGQGSKSNPYLEIPTVGTNNMTVKTVNIPAGKSLYYSIYRVGGMVLTINSANAYVVCDGTRYDAKNGVVSFVVPAALASDAISFEIGNKGSSAASFTLTFTNLTGTQANPYVVSSIGSQIKISLVEGDSDGYNYKYKAEKTGTVRFYMTATVTSIMSVTNNRTCAQRTTEADSQSDANGTYIELDVQAGDEIIIIVGAKPNARGKYPATTITWSGTYI